MSMSCEQNINKTWFANKQSRQEHTHTDRERDIDIDIDLLGSLH